MVEFILGEAAFFALKTNKQTQMTFLDQNKDSYYTEGLEKYSLEAARSNLADDTKPLCLIFIKFCELARVFNQLKNEKLKVLLNTLASVQIDSLLDYNCPDYIFQNFLKVALFCGFRTNRTILDQKLPDS